MMASTDDHTMVISTPSAWIRTWLPMEKSSPPVPPRPGAANTPTRMAPMMPPMPWMPNTSSESSAPSIFFKPLTPHRQTKPATRPMMMPPMGPTDPQAGVMATRPATAPEAAPSMEALPLLRASPMLQASTAAAVANKVLMNGRPTPVLASRLEPALNPNQPTHSSEAPTMVSVRL